MRRLDVVTIAIEAIESSTETAESEAKWTPREMTLSILCYKSGPFYPASAHIMISSRREPCEIVFADIY